MSGARPMVSVVIPNYNHARYISDAIRSVLSQDYQPYEIIVVDDGSSDNSREVVAGFGDRVRYIWQENSGLSAARNTGLRAATGEYVGVLDADDMYEPAFMSTLVPILEAHPDAGAVYCGYQFVDEVNRPLPQIESRDVAPDQLYRTLAEGNFLVPESILVRRRCYAEVGPFDVTLRAVEDLDMWLRICSRYPVRSSTHVLVRHRVLPGSMSTHADRQCSNRLAVVRKHFGPERPDPESMTEVQRRVYARAYLTAAVEHLQAGLDDGATTLFRRAARLFPSMLLELETFYELGCGRQAKGFRGDFSTLDLAASQTIAENLLREALEGLAETGAGSVPVARAWATAHFAFGLLHYGRKDLGAARSAFLRAIGRDVSYLREPRFIPAFVRSLLPAGVTDAVRRAKRSLLAPGA